MCSAPRPSASSPIRSPAASLTAFLDYWIDLRKIEDSTPSTALYNDYYLDDALTGSRGSSKRNSSSPSMLRCAILPARNIIDSNYTFLNERLATHYNLPTTSKASQMRRVDLATR